MCWETCLFESSVIYHTSRVQGKLLLNSTNLKENAKTVVEKNSHMNVCNNWCLTSCSWTKMFIDAVYIMEKELYFKTQKDLRNGLRRDWAGYGEPS